MKTKRRLPEHAPKEGREGHPAAEQAEPYIRQAITEMKRGRLGVRSERQAIAIGMRRARRAGIPVEVPMVGVAPARGGASPRGRSRRR